MRDEDGADVNLKLFFEGEDFDWSKYCGLRHNPLNDELSIFLHGIILSDCRIGHVGRTLV
jgi:hypothetical protein